MVMKKKGLGRGLDALLGGGIASGGRLVDSPVPGTVGGDSELRHLPVTALRRGQYQPRSDMREEALLELADSIRAQGVVQPIVVRPIAGENYEIIAGERRWRAAQMAGLQQVPAVIRHVKDQDAMAMALIENIQRENLNPMEEAGAIRRLIDEFELTHQMAAEAVGRSRAAVSNLLRLFELNVEVKELLERRELEMGHARALLGLGAEAQTRAAREVVAKGLSVRETEQLVRRLRDGAPATRPAVTAQPQQDPDILRLQDELSQRLGATVSLQHSAKGKGKLVISYHNLDELEGILAHIS
ncbi:MAG: ParB/RepB/Spo0J family partition protein [Gammaproteobacteria bacterium]|nr:ParB/RepB/Spo0J family partition protein [Gammaproteobacteria bacterium]